MAKMELRSEAASKVAQGEILRVNMGEGRHMSSLIEFTDYNNLNVFVLANPSIGRQGRN